LHHAGAMPQILGQLLGLQATFSFVGHSGYVVDGHMPCDTSAALKYPSSPDCQSDSVQSLFDLKQILDHDVDIALLEYEISSQLRPNHNHAADFFFSMYVT
jgi:hypothetical protein